MAALKFSFISLLLVASCATASGPESVNINNQLSTCIVLNDIQTSVDGKTPILSFTVQVNKSIGECGCKSALGSYTVFSKSEGYQSYLIGGKVSFANPEKKYLPLSTEESLVKKRNLEVILSCSRPD